MGPRPMLYSSTVKRHALKPSTSTKRNVKLRKHQNSWNYSWWTNDFQTTYRIRYRTGQKQMGKASPVMHEKRDLSRRILVTLYKTLILPLVLYCAPVWTLANYTRLNSFQGFILRNIMKTTHNPNSKAAEVLGLPPIDILCKNNIRLVHD